MHVNVSLTQPKVHPKNHPVTITGVYHNIFRMEDRTGENPSTHIVQYVDLMMGHVEIKALTQK